MIRVVVVVVFACFVNFCYAQDDYYPDYRSKRELFARIVEKDIRSDISTFSMGGIDEGVGKEPLRSLPVVDVTPNSITFGENNLKVTITTAPFDASKHKLGYMDEKKFLAKIDNKGYFGDYGKLPKTEIESVTLIAARDTIQVPKVAFADIYNPMLYAKEGGNLKTNNKVYLSNDGKKMYVYMLKREAGGSYEVTWVFQDNKYLRRVVDFGFLK